MNKHTHRTRYASVLKMVLITALYIMFAAIVYPTWGQTTQIKGIIRDAANAETLPHVTVSIIGGLYGSGTISDQDGRYEIEVDGSFDKLRFSYIGYLPQDVTFQPGQQQVIDINLQVDATMLDEVVVTAKRGRYRNRDNPAVQLIRKVIEHKDGNRLSGQDYVQYEEYEKISFALSNLSEKFKNRRIFKDFQFLFQEQDSVGIDGRYSLPAYMQEKVTQVYYRKSPRAEQRYVIAERRAEFDPKFMSNSNLDQSMSHLYQHIDIYDNNVTFLTNQFLSPIANSSPTFYKFFITDTIKTQTPWLVELGFVPRSTTDQLFTGKLYITLDGHYAVKQAYLTVDDNINLNFIRDMQLTLLFEEDNNGKYYLDKSDLYMDFGISGQGSGVQGKRLVNYRNYESGIAMADDVYRGMLDTVSRTHEAPHQDLEQYWAQLRHVPLANHEQHIYRNIDTLQSISSFRRMMDWGTVLIAGYKALGPVEVGPVNTFYSFNPVEGFRLRLGGRTTTDLSKRFYAETYAAYGFRDQKWKYFLSGTYALNNKSVYNFPQHYIRASYQRDTKVPGESLQFIQEDNFLLSFKRGDNYRWLYNDIFRLEYLHELENNFSYGVGLAKWKQQPAGILTYQQTDEAGNTTTHRELNTTEVNVRLRYAPNEQFFQGKLYRSPLYNEYPVFTLNYTAGIKDFLGGEYNYHTVAPGAFKRFYLSQLGYADVNLEAAYTFGEDIPFPLLTLHRANQTYAYQLNSFNLMNFMEFVSDRHVSVNVQYYMNGFLFNKIPLLNRLKWREAFSFKAIWGQLSDANNPYHNRKVFDFQEQEGVPITYTLHDGPYIEASAGIANIFKLFRVDIVRRFTYLDHPQAPKWGIRARFKLDF